MARNRRKAEGSTVNFMMWQGSPTINNYINNYVVPSVKEKYNINLKISGGQGPEIVQLVMGEKQADIDQRTGRYGLDKRGDLFPAS